MLLAASFQTQCTYEFLITLLYGLDSLQFTVVFYSVAGVAQLVEH